LIARNSRSFVNRPHRSVWTSLVPVSGKDSLDFLGSKRHPPH